ncbi:MAG: type IIL restriction-modification enzyme MmeI, partial [Phycisphaerales bacterium]
MDADRQRQLQAFVDYAKTLDGDEKGEAQVFLDRLFRAFSRGGYKEAGATLEDRVRTDRGTTSFADLIWKPKLLVEMKKRGEDLSRHVQQARDYWVFSAPNRPKQVVLCNFDEFRIYEFDKDVFEPQDVLRLDELPQRCDPLNSLWPTNEKVRYRIDREDATRKAAAKLSAIYQSLKAKHPRGAQGAQRFVLQALVCFFSEDIGLLPRAFFTDLLEECTEPPKSFDLLDGLFRAMNQHGGVAGGRYKGVEYFN